MATVKTIIVCLIIFVFSMSGCSNNTSSEDKQYNAIITGYDMRMCMCCGGLMVTFQDNPTPYSGKFYLIHNSSELGIDEKTTFPIYVNITWVEKDFCSPSIIVTSYKKIK